MSAFAETGGPSVRLRASDATGASEAAAGDVALPDDGTRRMEVLFAATHTDLLRFVLRRVGHDLADDVVAEAYLVAWRRLDLVPDTTDEARAWLFAVARRCLANRARTERRQDAVAVRIATQPAAQHATDDDGVVTRLDVGRAWAQLTARDQEVLALVAWDGLTHAQAGQVLGVSAAAFGVRLMRARRRLRRHLESGAPDPRAPGTGEPHDEGGH